MSELAALRATVYGRVQGVFFRAFVSGQAGRLGLNGYVRSLPSGAVELEAEGERAKLEDLLAKLKEGPPRSNVEKVIPVWSAYQHRYSNFNIRH